MTCPNPTCVLPAAVIAFMACIGASAQLAPPKVPANLRAPDSETVSLKVVGKGKQIYACTARPDGSFAWVLDRPQAELTDAGGSVIGKHYKGPVWEATDGSKVGGKVDQRANAPDPNAVPWLLLKSTTREGNGVFSHVTYIQRVDTQGGAPPPSGCDQSHVRSEISSDYQATYYFYHPRAQ